MSSLALSYVVNLLARREYSEFELRNKMQEKAFTEDEIDEIWKREDPGDEPIKQNGKYFWETAKRVRGYINAHEELIQTHHSVSIEK